MYKTSLSILFFFKTHSTKRNSLTKRGGGRKSRGGKIKFLSIRALSFRLPNNHLKQSAFGRRWSWRRASEEGRGKKKRKKKQKTKTHHKGGLGDEL